jgi:hypothetical protein
VLRLLCTNRLVDNLVIAIQGGDVPAIAAVLLVIGSAPACSTPSRSASSSCRSSSRRRWCGWPMRVGRGAAAAEIAVELPAAAFRLCADDGARSREGPAQFRPFVRALIRFLAAQWLLLAAVLAMPAPMHLGEHASDLTRAPEKPLNQGEIDKQLRDMVPLRELQPMR